jgi:hypothetical protein
MGEKKVLAVRLITVILTTAVAFTATVAAATEGAAHPSATSSCKSIVGSWEVVDDHSGAIFLGAYNGGPLEGTVNFTSPHTATSLTHGVWRRTGSYTFADTNVTFLSLFRHVPAQVCSACGEIWMEETTSSEIDRLITEGQPTRKVEPRYTSFLVHDNDDHQCAIAMITNA